MNELQILSYEGNNVRTIQRDGETWWVLRDVCEVLEISNSRDAASRLDEDEKDDVGIADAIGRQQNTTIISESGLYGTIMLSRKPEAKKFKRWVTHDVLPTIRKTGGYIPVYEDDSEMEIMARAVLIATNTIKEKDKIIEEKSAQIERDKPKVMFAEAVLPSPDTIMVGDLAKIICQNGIEIGEKRLFAWLREKKFLMSRGDQRNLPYQTMVKRKLFVINEKVYHDRYGIPRISKSTRITPKGQQLFINMFAN